MQFISFAVVAFALALANPAKAQTPPVASESRDASIAYLGTTNFVVGRIGRDCLELLGRTETPQQFVGTWQQRNAKYLVAMQKYLNARLGDAEASGGPTKKQAIINELSATVRGNAEAIVKNWLDQPDRLGACRSAVTKIEGGSLDVLPSMKMFGELEALVAWAQ